MFYTLFYLLELEKDKVKLSFRFKLSYYTLVEMYIIQIPIFNAEYLTIV